MVGIGRQTKLAQAQTFERGASGMHQLLQSAETGGRAILTGLQVGGELAIVYFIYRALRDMSFERSPSKAEVQAAWSDRLLMIVSPAIWMMLQGAREPSEQRNILKTQMYDFVSMLGVRYAWEARVYEKQGPYKPGQPIEYVTRMELAIPPLEALLLSFALLWFFKTVINTGAQAVGGLLSAGKS